MSDAHTGINYSLNSSIAEDPDDIEKQQKRKMEPLETEAPASPLVRQADVQMQPMALVGGEDDDDLEDVAGRIARGPRNNVLRSGEIFEYDREEIERGNYKPSLKIIKSKMCNALVNNGCELFLIIWLIFFLKGNRTAPIYSAEKYWMLSWIIAQFLSYQVYFLAGVYACRNPRILLNHQW